MLRSKPEYLSADQFEKRIAIEKQYRTRFSDVRGNGTDDKSIEHMGINIYEFCQIEPLHLYWCKDEPFSLEALERVDPLVSQPLKLFAGRRRFGAIEHALEKYSAADRDKVKIHVRIYERTDIIKYLEGERDTYGADELDHKDANALESAIDGLLLRIASSSNAFLVATSPLDKLIVYNTIYRDLRAIHPDCSHKDMLRYFGTSEKDTQYRMSLRYFYIVQNPDLYEAVVGSDEKQLMNRILKLSTGEYVAEMFRAHPDKLKRFLATVKEYVSDLNVREGFKEKDKAPCDWKSYSNKIVLQWAKETLITGQPYTEWKFLKFAGDKKDRLVYLSEQSGDDTYRMKATTRKGMGPKLTLSGINIELTSIDDESKIRLLVDLHYKIQRLTENLFGWIGGVQPPARGGSLKDEREVPLSGVRYDRKYLNYIHKYKLERYANLREVRAAIRHEAERGSREYPKDPVPESKDDDFEKHPEEYRTLICEYLVKCHTAIEVSRKIERTLSHEELRQARTANEEIARVFSGLVSDMRMYEQKALKPTRNKEKQLNSLIEGSDALRHFGRLVDSIVEAKANLMQVQGDNGNGNREHQVDHNGFGNLAANNGANGNGHYDNGGEPNSETSLDDADDDENTSYDSDTSEEYV